MIREPWVLNIKVGRVKDKNAEVRFLSFLSIQRINFLGHDIKVRKNRIYRKSFAYWYFPNMSDIQILSDFSACTDCQ